MEYVISIFLCEKDSDIEGFLKNRAIDFEKAGKSRTFFIFDEESDDFNILAYYTIALQVLNIPETYSNRKIKDLDGMFSKSNGETIYAFPAILIGQLAKNDTFKSCISGEEIMQFCMSTIMDGQIRLSGRIIMLECKEVQYLLDLYGKFGFEKIEREYKKGDLLQFVRKLNEEEIMR